MTRSRNRSVTGASSSTLPPCEEEAKPTKKSLSLPRPERALIRSSAGVFRFKSFTPERPTSRLQYIRPSRRSATPSSTTTKGTRRQVTVARETRGQIPDVLFGPDCLVKSCNVSSYDDFPCLCCIVGLPKRQGLRRDRYHFYENVYYLNT